MLKNFLKKPDKCKICYNPLDPKNRRMGFCRECAAKEVAKLIKRIKVSSLVGIFLAAIVLLAIYYIKTYGYLERGNTVIPVFDRFWIFSEKVFKSLENFPVSSFIQLGLLLFFAPFGEHPNFKTSTYRDKGEAIVYAYGRSSQMSEGMGLGIVEFIFSLVSGPFFFFYRPYRIWRLSKK